MATHDTIDPPVAEDPVAAPFGACREPVGPRLLARVLSDRRLPRPLRAAARRRLRALAPRGPVDLHVEGIRFRAFPADNKVDFDLWAKRRLDEPAELAFLVGSLAPGDVFVDVGANIGAHTLAAVLRGPPGVTALAVEPHPALRTRLRVNAALNGLSGAIAVSDRAVGPAEGRARLHLGGRNAGASTLLAPVAGERTADVAVSPLARILAAQGIARVGVLKADVEGVEDRALLPFFETAPESAWPHALVVEHAHRGAWQTDCLSTLEDLGYMPVGNTAENTMLRRR